MCLFVCLFQVMERKYEQKCDIAPAITFDENSVVQLQIPDDGQTIENKWQILPLHRTSVSI